MSTEQDELPMIGTQKHGTGRGTAEELWSTADVGGGPSRGPLSENLVSKRSSATSSRQPAEMLTSKGATLKMLPGEAGRTSRTRQTRKRIEKLPDEGILLTRPARNSVNFLQHSMKKVVLVRRGERRMVALARNSTTTSDEVAHQEDLQESTAMTPNKTDTATASAVAGTTGGIHDSHFASPAAPGAQQKQPGHPSRAPKRPRPGVLLHGDVLTSQDGLRLPAEIASTTANQDHSNEFLASSVQTTTEQDGEIEDPANCARDFVNPNPCEEQGLQTNKHYTAYFEYRNQVQSWWMPFVQELPILSQEVWTNVPRSSATEENNNVLSADNSELIDHVCHHEYRLEGIIGQNGFDVNATKEFFHQEQQLLQEIDEAMKQDDARHDIVEEWKGDLYELRQGFHKDTLETERFVYEHCEALCLGNDRCKAWVYFIFDEKENDEFQHQEMSTTAMETMNTWTTTDGENDGTSRDLQHVLVPPDQRWCDFYSKCDEKVSMFDYVDQRDGVHSSLREPAQLANLRTTRIYERKNHVVGDDSTTAPGSVESDDDVNLDDQEGEQDQPQESDQVGGALAVPSTSDEQDEKATTAADEESAPKDGEKDEESGAGCNKTYLMIGVGVGVFLLVAAAVFNVVVGSSESELHSIRMTPEEEEEKMLLSAANRGNYELSTQQSMLGSKFAALTSTEAADLEGAEANMNPGSGLLTLTSAGGTTTTTTGTAQGNKKKLLAHQRRRAAAAARARILEKNASTSSKLSSPGAAVDNQAGAVPATAERDLFLSDSGSSTSSAPATSDLASTSAFVPQPPPENLLQSGLELHAGAASTPAGGLRTPPSRASSSANSNPSSQAGPASVVSYIKGPTSVSYSRSRSPASSSAINLSSQAGPASVSSYRARAKAKRAPSSQRIKGGAGAGEKGGAAGVRAPSDGTVEPIHLPSRSGEKGGVGGFDQQNNPT
ncbi:unnamed protein product [Amoebophrya sp. A120]|nr:unnamed protein product [Amoebophrya sp. A120]|eukprot:GSA120T00012379001.1